MTGINWAELYKRDREMFTFLIKRKTRYDRDEIFKGVSMILGIGIVELMIDFSRTSVI
jgi:hypothetical protein